MGTNICYEASWSDVPVGPYRRDRQPADFSVYTWLRNVCDHTVHLILSHHYYILHILYAIESAIVSIHIWCTKLKAMSHVTIVLKWSNLLQ
jgi:hypothetical protein